MAETEFRKVANTREVPLSSLRNGPITIGYISPGKCRRYYTANLLGHDEKYIYMGSGGNNHVACLSELHLFGRLINRVNRFRKSEVVEIIALEAIIHYDIFGKIYKNMNS